MDQKMVGVSDGVAGRHQDGADEAGLSVGRILGRLESEGSGEGRPVNKIGKEESYESGSTRVENGTPENLKKVPTARTTIAQTDSMMGHWT
jgi:hypothetical protein